MNKVMIFAVFAVLLFSFVSADDVFSDPLSYEGVPTPIVDPAPIGSVSAELGVSISLTSPVNGFVFETADGDAPLSFSFMVSSGLIDPSNVASEVVGNLQSAELADGSLDCSVFVRANGENAVELATVFDGSEGKAESNFVLNSYKWYVSCSNDLRSWNSEERGFVIAPLTIALPNAPPAPVTNAGESSSGGGGSSSNDDEGRSNPALRNRVNLANANTPDDSTQEPTVELNGESSKKGLARITGAVIGAVGKTGAFVIIILLVVVGAFSTLAYNRRKAIKNSAK